MFASGAKPDPTSDLYGRGRKRRMNSFANGFSHVRIGAVGLIEIMILHPGLAFSVIELLAWQQNDNPVQRVRIEQENTSADM